MIDQKQVKLANGSTITIDIVELFERNEKIHIAVMGIDFNQFTDGFHFEIGGEVEMTRIGKLMQQTRWPAKYLQQILIAELWDWKKYPDPEVVIIARKSKIILN